MNPEHLAKIIGDKEGSPCAYIESVEVKERFKGKAVWSGVVHVFSLNRPPEEKCYAWIDPDSESLVTVLNRPPVESPETAVRAFIVSMEKNMK